MRSIIKVIIRLIGITSFITIGLAWCNPPKTKRYWPKGGAPRPILLLSKVESLACRITPPSEVFYETPLLCQGEGSRNG